MNVKKIYYNAPAPLFAMTLDDSNRDIGFTGILCYAAASLHKKTGADIERCRIELCAPDLPDNALEIGWELAEKYRHFIYFGIERTKFYDFRDNYKGDEERVLLLAYLASVAILKGRSYCLSNNDNLLSVMNGNVNESGELLPIIEEYKKRRKMSHLKELLYKYYKVSTYSRTRGFYISTSLTFDELKATIENRREEKKETTPTIEKKVETQDDLLCQIIAQKDSEIASLRKMIADLKEENAKLRMMAGDKNDFENDEETASIYKSAREVFESFYSEKTSNAYYWEGKDAGCMKQLLTKLKNDMESRGEAVTTENTIQKLSHFLHIITDKWILSHLSVTVVNSKYNEIISCAASNLQTANNMEIESISQQDDMKFEGVTDFMGKPQNHKTFEAYGLYFETQEEVDAFSKEQQEIRDRLERNELSVADDDVYVNISMNLPVKVIDGVVYDY